MKIVIVGINGSIAETYRQVFEELHTKDITVVAGIDISGKAGKWNIPVYNSWDAFIKANLEVDAVEILTPPHTHKELVLKSLTAGYHTLVEKPAAFTVEECSEMISCAHAQERTLFFCYHMIYAAGVDELKKEIEGKTLKHVWLAQLENVREYRLPGTTDFAPGALWDSGINILSVLLYVAPQLADISIDKISTWKSPSLKAMTHVTADFSWPDGKGMLPQNWILPKNTVRIVEIETEQDIYHLDIHNQVLLKNNEILVQGQSGAYIREYSEQQEHFIDCVNSNSTFTLIEPIKVVQDITNKFNV